MRFVVDGFVYHNNLISGNPPLRYLGCAEHKRAGCRGRATLPVNGTLNQLKITQPHNHPPDITAEEKHAFVIELKNAVRSMENSTLKNVYESVAEIYPQDFKFTIDATEFSIVDDHSGQKIKKKKARTRTRYVIGGFVYHNKLVAGKIPIRYLACAEMKRAGCRARAILPVCGTADQIRITKPHNHPPDENAAEREDFINHLKQAVRSMPGSLRKVYDTIAALYPKGSTELPFRSVCSSLHRWRRSLSASP